MQLKRSAGSGLNVVMLGPPGAGKGTQAERLARARGRCRRSRPATSCARRSRRARRSGCAARETMDAGRLVSDDVMIGIVGERLDRDDARRGFVLDGFPRTVVQATALDRHDERPRPAGRARHRRAGGRAGAAARDAAHLRPTAAPTRRSSGRRTCEKCGGALVTRTDDDDEIVRERLKVYQRQTQAARGLLLGPADVPADQRQPAARRRDGGSRRARSTSRRRREACTS